VVRDGYAYGLDEGVLACIDLATGERKWKDGHYGFGELVLVHDLLLVQTEPGPVALVEANPAEFREAGRVNALDFQNLEQSRGGRGLLSAGAQRQGSDLLQNWPCGLPSPSWRA